MDDNKIARQSLISVLEKDKEVTEIIEFDNGLDCINNINNCNPDIIFLDIDLNGSSGIEVAEIIQKNNPEILIIFATGLIEFGAKAFEFDAIDYLVKPFSEIRVVVALKKAKQKLKFKQQNNNATKLPIKSGSNIHLVEICDIKFIEKVSKKTIIHTKDQEIETYQSLNSLTEKLPYYFMRTHQSYLVNVKDIKELEPYSATSYSIVFHKTNKTALLLRTKYDELCDKLQMESD